MARKRQHRNRIHNRNASKHILAVNVTSRRILVQQFLRKSRHFLIYSFVTCVILLLCWGAIHSARKLVMDGERFQLTSIEITPKPTKTSFFGYENLPQITNLTIGESIFAHNLKEIRETLQNYPEVKEAKLSRRYPGTISVELIERVPRAMLQYEDSLYLVDADGFCFQPGLENQPLLRTLPTIQTQFPHDVPFDSETMKLSEVGLYRALDLSMEWNTDALSGEELRTVQVKDLHSLTATTSTGTKLTFGYYEHKRQIRDFSSIQKHASENGLRIELANLLPYENIPVIFAEQETPSTQEHQQPASQPQNSNSDLMKILKQG